MHLLGGASALDYFRGDYAAARARSEERVGLLRTVGDAASIAGELFCLGCMAREQEDYAAACTALEECLTLAQGLEDMTGIACALDALGTVAHARGDYGLARSRIEEALAFARRADDPNRLAWSFHSLGCLDLDEGDYPAARARLEASLARRGEYDNPGFVHLLAAFASLAAAEKRPERAMRLAGAAAVLTQKTGIAVQRSERGRNEHWLATARQALKAEAAASAWTAGQAMPLDQALIYARETDHQTS